MEVRRDRVAKSRAMRERPSVPWRRWVLLAAALLAIGPVGLVGAEASPLPPTAVVPTAPAELEPLWAFGPDDLHVVSTEQVSDRIVDVTFRTPALTDPTTARIILPTGYDPAADVRYPVLFLLHGGAGQYRDWSLNGAVELTADLPLITVLPDAGRSAWYTDWFNNGAGGPPMWETYHLGQLLPWVDQHFQTVGTRAGRAIAGLSSGGFGTMSYASRHPDHFVAAASFSGALDTNTPPVVAGKAIDGLAAQDGGLPGSLFGLRELHEVRWRGHNPWDLAENLRHLSLVVRAGNGMAGGEFGGGGPTDPGGFVLEKATYDMSVSFHERLVALDVDHVWDDYGAGTHTYAYWIDGLAKALPVFMDAFAEQRPDPSAFTYRSVEPTYDIFDWRVALDRPVVEFSELDVDPTGFALRGSGSATVTTAPAFVPNQPYDVLLTRADGSTEQRTVRADRSGRLTLDVPLGAANAVQQLFLPTHDSPLTTVHETRVDIARTKPGSGR